MDPNANPHPEKLDLERRPNRHLSFGTGIHFCLGHQLARIEGKCALEALFKRWPELELAVPADSFVGGSGLASGPWKSFLSGSIANKAVFGASAKVALGDGKHG